LLFLPGGGIGHNFGQIAPQVSRLDIFYDQPPVVGLQIIGATDSDGD
jgi:hypothetical protein